MNKVDFLRKLDRELSVLSKEERRELLAFYEERFHTGTIYENKTEEQVIAELESPEAIAKNILEEFGVSKTYVKTETERYSNISLGRVILLLSFDLIVATWLIPTLFSVAISVLGSSIAVFFSSFTTMVGDVTTIDEFMFASILASSVLLFLFGLVVLEALLWSSKKLIIWHLNVFKIKGREKWIKSLSKWSLDGWFKRHRLLRAIKNWALVISLVTLAYTGFWLVSNNEAVFAQYDSGEQQSESFTQDFTTEIANLDEWDIITDFESNDVEIVLVSGTEFKIHRSYTDSEEVFEYDFDTVNNVLTISTDSDDFKFVWSFEDIFSMINSSNIIRIEVPENLLLDHVEIDTINGEIDVTNVDANSYTLESSNGTIDIENIVVNGNVKLHTSNGTIIARDIIANGEHKLTADTSNGRIDIKNVDFAEYHIDTSNGVIDLENFNVDNQDGVSILVDTSNGAIYMDNVYVDDIDLNTTNGSISFYNDDETFLPSKFEKDTTNGSISTNVR